MTFDYDDKGFRVSKINDQGLENWYVQDASGNIVAIYEKADASAELVQKEIPIYTANKIGTYFPQELGEVYELTDHLSNVRAVVKEMDETVTATMETSEVVVEEIPF